jgi:hypothetical protein
MVALYGLFPGGSMDIHLPGLLMRRNISLKKKKLSMK